MITFKIETGFGLEVKKAKIENMDKIISILNNKCMSFTVLDENHKIIYKSF